jgi:hypothetical protein
MSDYLSNLAIKINHPERVVRPQLASLFEPSPLVQVPAPPPEQPFTEVEAAPTIAAPTIAAPTIAAPTIAASTIAASTVAAPSTTLSTAAPPQPAQPTPVAAKRAHTTESPAATSITTVDPAPRSDSLEARREEPPTVEAVESKPALREPTLSRPAGQQRVESPPYEPHSRPPLDRAAVPPPPRADQPSLAGETTEQTGDSHTQRRRLVTADPAPVSPCAPAGDAERLQHAASQMRHPVRVEQARAVPSRAQADPAPVAPSSPGSEKIPAPENALLPARRGPEEPLRPGDLAATRLAEASQPADGPPGRQRSVSPERPTIQPAVTAPPPGQESPRFSPTTSQATSIQITIGRIEVRAVAPRRERPQPPPRQAERPRPKLSLDGYLQQRRGEK